jgi:hypothetical protein
LTELALKACFFTPSLPRDPSIFPERRSVVKALLAGTEGQPCFLGPASTCSGKLQRNRERITVHNDNHNKDLKNLFKSAAISASKRPSPLHDFYVARVEKGMRPTMARLTLARKMATITPT